MYPIVEILTLSLLQTVIGAVAVDVNGSFGTAPINSLRAVAGMDLGYKQLYHLLCFHIFLAHPLLLPLSQYFI